MTNGDKIILFKINFEYVKLLKFIYAYKTSHYKMKVKVNNSSKKKVGKRF